MAIDPIQEIRVLSGEPTGTSTYSDNQLQDILDEVAGSVDSAVARVWREKAAATAKYFNSGNKNLEQIYKHNKEMADYYDKRVASGIEETPPDPTASAPRTRAIVRA